MKADNKQVIENQIIESISEDRNLFLVSVKIDAKNHISVFLDGDNGISIGQCTSINRSLYKFIEENELFPNNDFSLEVSSAGVDEPLVFIRQYQKNINRELEVLLKNGVKYIGKLVNINENHIGIEVITGKGKKAVTTIENIDLANVKSSIVQIKF